MNGPRIELKKVQRHRSLFCPRRVRSRCDDWNCAAVAAASMWESRGSAVRSSLGSAAWLRHRQKPWDGTHHFTDAVRRKPNTSHTVSSNSLTRQVLAESPRGAASGNTERQQTRGLPLRDSECGRRHRKELRLINIAIGVAKESPGVMKCRMGRLTGLRRVRPRRRQTG